MNCKVRFAPSPTGFMHIGNARIAIINYLFCAKNQGKFLFRIDDTDILRSKKEYEDAIRDYMKWLGISYDETFRQTERIGRYNEVMDELIDRGILYKCYETPEELEYKRRNAISKGKPPVYDRASLNLSEDEKQKLESEGVQGYWRFKLPNKIVSWDDLILGNVSYNLNSVSDPVIAKADGTYLYTFSSVVDDIDSEITHIIRGQDHVTNTAVQIAMFDEISNCKYKVEFAHLSLLVNKDGSQFSKRLGSTNIGEIRDSGVDPMAICDLLATLGSSLDTIPFSKMSDLVEYFDITKFSTNSPKFDIDDILKINKKIIHSKSYNDIKSEIDLKISEKEFEIIKENIENYNDFAIWADVLKCDFNPKYIPDESGKNVLKVAIEEFSKIEKIDEISGKELLNQIKIKANVSGKELFMPLRGSLTDMGHGPNIVLLFAIFGKDEVLRRFNFCLSKN